MTTLSNLIRNEINPRCLTRGKLKKEGCEVKMTNAPTPRFVIDLDKSGAPVAANKVRCDYLMIAVNGNGKGLIAVFELKRGLLRVQKIVEQLRAGADIADELVTNNPKIEIEFQPVAVFGRVNKQAMADLKKPENRITFRKREKTLVSISCGP